ncbi:TetR/AcrR family transcriptional regulator [Pseudonocardia sp.]|uniref:TetR/AcrR family transcriptional regulator n=1 Tax=Pseudonocardia sp. TaxID=60912 RepID=UPI003D112F10
MIGEGVFHRASVAELARRAGVARATVFGRFGSKLGVLEALATRCAGGPEMRGIREAIVVDEPRAAVTAVVRASCVLWERQGHILLTLKAVTELEPGAVALVDDQRADQRTSLEGLVARLDAAEELRAGLTPHAATAALHMTTSVESFVELRTHGELSFDTTVEVLTGLATSLLR